MDILKKNQLFVISSLATASMGIYMLYDAFISYQQTNKANNKQKPLKNQKKNIKTQNRSLENAEQQLFRICLTGGPCGGKTTALVTLNERLTEQGFKVFVVPETVSLTKEGGGMLIMSKLPDEKVIKFQTEMIKMQMALEDYFTDLAVLSGQPAVVLCDRGIMDFCAYIAEETWQVILDEQGWNTVNLRDRRYDAVLHMVTAADNANEFFLQGSQEKDAKKALDIDKKLQMAWIGHPHFSIIDNYEKGFEKKVDRVYNQINKLLGLPVSRKIFKKFLVKDFNIPSNTKFEIFQVEEVYLRSENKENTYTSIRKRGQNGTFTYLHSTRVNVNDPDDRYEIKRQISAKDYMILYEQRDDNYKIIQKERLCFVWEKKYFKIDRLLNSDLDKFVFLRVEALSKKQDIKIPEFVNIICDVTDDSKYFTQIIARQK